MMIRKRGGKLALARAEWVNLNILVLGSFVNLFWLLTATFYAQPKRGKSTVLKEKCFLRS